MKPIITFFTLTLLIVLFSGCTQAVHKNRTENHTETAEVTNVQQQKDQEEMEEGKAYIGKHLLAGLTYRNSEGEVIKRFQLHGKITRITKSGIFFNRADGKGEFALPPDLESLEPVIPGAEYRLKSTDEVVRDADYISNWIIDLPPDKEDE